MFFLFILAFLRLQQIVYESEMETGRVEILRPAGQTS